MKDKVEMNHICFRIISQVTSDSLILNLRFLFGWGKEERGGGREGMGEWERGGILNGKGTMFKRSYISI